MKKIRNVWMNNICPNFEENSKTVGAGPVSAHKEKGITLVALIITIIIMLILVGVSVQVLIDSDLIGTAQNAVNRTEKTYEQEGNIGEIVVGGKIYASMEDYVNGVEKILDDSLPENEYLKTFITEWTVEAGDTITLPIYEMQATDEERGEVETYFNYNFTVDYGDGTIAEITSFDDADRIHTYSEAGTYKVKIDGVCEAWGFYTVGDSATKVTKLEQWGVVGAKHIDFGNCTNLTGEIPVPSLNSFKDVESFRMLFYHCSDLKDEIPANLFQYATNVVTLGNIFDTAGVTGTIPEDLLVNCTELTNVRALFGKTGLEGSIPENLLKNCTKIENVAFLFSNCKNLTGNIPEELLKNCNNLKNASYLFQNCIGLTGTIPEELFENKVNITDLGYAFKGCEGLSGSIPENLLKDCGNLESVAYTFQNCSGLTGSIPTDLFINNSKITRMRNCFDGCTGLSDSEIKVTTTFASEELITYDHLFANININATLCVLTGTYKPSKYRLSTTANVTVVEYDLE